MRKLLTGACLVLLIVVPTGLQAQVALGPQLSFADDADFGIGARATLGLPMQTVPLEATASFDYFFPDGDFTYWEINTNVVYLFNLPAAPTVTPYAGGGFNIAHVSIDQDVFGVGTVSFSNTDLGFNLLGGAKFNVGTFTPYGELRIELGGGEQFVFAGGVQFTVGPGL